MRNHSHRIRRQIIELEVPRRAVAAAIQDQASRVHKNALVPLINRLCGAASPPDRIDRIDRIELDLGEIPAGELESELVERLTAALAEALAREIGANQRRRRGGQTDEARSALELVAVFARTGQVPWWADSSRAGLLEDAMATLLRDAPVRLAALVTEIADDGDALRRIAIACSDGRLAEIFGLLAGREQLTDGSAATAPRSSAALGAAVVALVQSAAPALGISPERLRAIAWHSVLYAAARHRASSFDSLCKEALIAVALALKTTYRAVVGHVRAASEVPEASVSGPRGALSQIIEELDERIPRRGRRPRARTDAERESESPSGSPSPSLPGLPPKPAEPFQLSPFTAADEIYVETCGLVLLGPFLGHFLANVGLLEDGELGDQGARHRAIGLLHYLVTRSPAPEEYQVPLAKLLCGVELSEVVEPGPPIAPAEAEECERFLEAVIGHAPILNQMSPESFRQAYLARNGVLSARDGGWLLRVERETYDVVLDHLPWSADWIKLPWMDDLLRVEWISP